MEGCGLGEADDFGAEAEGGDAAVSDHALDGACGDFEEGGEFATGDWSIEGSGSLSRLRFRVVDG